MRFVFPLLGGAAVQLLLTACAIEPDPQAVEDCKPAEIQCLSDDRIRTCTEDGLWGTPEPFVCQFGDCMIMGGVPVCM